MEFVWIEDFRKWVACEIDSITKSIHISKYEELPDIVEPKALKKLKNVF